MFSRISKLLTHIQPLFSENKYEIAGGIFVSGLNVGLNLLTPYIFSETIIALGTGTEIELLGMELSPMAVTGLYATAWTLNTISNNLRNLIFTPVAHKATERLVNKLVHAKMMQSIAYHQKIPLGDHQNLLMKCYIAIPNVSTEFFTKIFPTTLEVSIALGILSKLYGEKMALSLLGIMLTYTTFVVYTKTRLVELRKEMQKHSIKVYDDLTNIIVHYQTIHEFNTLQFEEEKLHLSTKAFSDAESAALSYVYKIGVGQNLIVGLGFTAICLLAAKEVLIGKQSVSDFIIIASYFSQFAIPLLQMGTGISQLLAAIEDLLVVVDDLENVPDVPDNFPDKPILAEANVAATIEFKNVSFSYDGVNPVLDNVSFKINAGEKVGIVGASGAGKSTVGNLIFRFRDPVEGKILINDQDIKTVSLFSLRNIISIVPQTPVLFNDTLQKNIAYAQYARGEEVKEEEIHNAVKAVSLENFVGKLPDGLNTVVGERGAKLSGGQRQRVAIARAFFKKPSIYIFDEATSALDSKVEQEIQSNLDRISKNNTTVVITHKLSNLLNADRIIVLHNAKIIEQGTHQELINLNGHYADLFNRQNAQEKDLEESREIAESLSSTSRNWMPNFFRSSSSRINSEKKEGIELSVRIDYSH